MRARHVFRSLCFLAAFLLCFTKASSQDTLALKANGQVWLDFYPHFYLTPNLQFYGDAGFRTLVTDAQWVRIHGRPSVRYHINNTLVAHGGIGLFLEFNRDQGTRFEVRPWQGIQVKWPTFDKLRFSHIIRTEERFNHLFETDETQFEFRLRARVGGNFQFDPNRDTGSFFVPFSVELFWPVTNSVDELFSNRTRITMGLGMNASPTLQFRLIGVWQGSRQGRQDSFAISDWIVRLQCRYSLDRTVDDDDLQ